MRSVAVALGGVGITKFTTLPPLSLYIHIPWCIKKCPYCDFNSHTVPSNRTGLSPISLDYLHAMPAGTPAESTMAGLEENYVDALIADLDRALPNVWGRRVYTVFFGGGTPSLFSARAIDKILSAVRARLNLEADAEITLEANPGTFERDKFRDFRAAGINRLSIGIQSFNAAHLAVLGRIHDSDEARRAIDIAQKHFDNINLDLMYALPSQSLEECEADIETALSYNTSHLSLYHLTLEPNTLFYQSPPRLPDDDLAADMQAMIEQRLAAAGYHHYETSAYAKAAKQSRHNLNYWRFGDYLGIGAGAHAKLTFPDKITREARYKQPKAYMDSASSGNAIAELRTLETKQIPFEFMLNALRLNAGFPLALFTERTGLPISVIERELSAAQSRGLIERDHLQIKPTALGQLFLNDLLEIFLV